MKTNILLAAALAFSVNAIAQSSCGAEKKQTTTTSSTDKMSSMNRQNVGNFTVSYIDPSWVTGSPAKAHYSKATAVVSGDGFKMRDKTMFAFKDGQQTDMLHYTTVKNGYVVLISGAVITSTGKVLFLKNGDSINTAGIITRNLVADNSVAAK